MCDKKSFLVNKTYNLIVKLYFDCRSFKLYFQFFLHYRLVKQRQNRRRDYIDVELVPPLGHFDTDWIF